MLWTTQRASSRALFTRWTDPALITVSTTRPAAISRIWPIASRCAASGVTAVMDKRMHIPRWELPNFAKRWLGGLVPLVPIGRSADGRLAGQILLEPVDMVVAVDDPGLPHQRPEQRKRGLDALDHHFIQRAPQPHQAFAP